MCLCTLCETDMEPEQFIRLTASCEPVEENVWLVCIQNVEDPTMTVDYTIWAKTDNLAVQQGMDQFTKSIRSGAPDSGRVKGIINAAYPRIVS